IPDSQILGESRWRGGREPSDPGLRPMFRPPLRLSRLPGVVEGSYGTVSWMRPVQRSGVRFLHCEVVSTSSEASGQSVDVRRRPSWGILAYESLQAFANCAGRPSR